jgi:hypothetical protein
VAHRILILLIQRSQDSNRWRRTPILETSDLFQEMRRDGFELDGARCKLACMVF